MPPRHRPRVLSTTCSLAMLPLFAAHVVAAQARAGAPSNQPGSAIANASPCPNANSSWDSCGGGPAGVTYVTTAQNWIRTIPRALTGGSKTEVTLTLQIDGSPGRPPLKLKRAYFDFGEPPAPAPK